MDWRLVIMIFNNYFFLFFYLFLLSNIYVNMPSQYIFFPKILFLACKNVYDKKLQ